MSVANALLLSVLEQRENGFAAGLCWLCGDDTREEPGLCKYKVMLYSTSKALPVLYMQNQC